VDALGGVVGGAFVVIFNAAARAPRAPRRAPVPDPGLLPRPAPSL